MSQNQPEVQYAAFLAIDWADQKQVLLHRLWVSGEVYEPLRNSQKAMSTAA